jgi:ribosome-associated protein
MAKIPPKRSAGSDKQKPQKKKKTSGTVKAKPVKKSTPAKKQAMVDDKANREANLIANLDKRKIKRPKLKRTSSEKTRALLDAVVDGMKEKKAKNILVLNLNKIENRVTDFFVVCDADSRIHVNSIAEGVTETAEKHSGELPYHTEGKSNGEWVLIDYINVVAHVFLKEMRDHYNIEGLWGDAEITLINS